MPAKRQKCEFCNNYFWASRSDSKWCSQKCRYQNRMENASFEFPVIPRSGIAGITFSRVLRTWQVTIREDKRRKFIGTAKELKEAIKLQTEVMKNE